MHACIVKPYIKWYSQEATWIYIGLILFFWFLTSHDDDSWCCCFVILILYIHTCDNTMVHVWNVYIRANEKEHKSDLARAKLRATGPATRDWNVSSFFFYPFFILISLYSIFYIFFFQRLFSRHSYISCLIPCKPLIILHLNALQKEQKMWAQNISLLLSSLYPISLNSFFILFFIIYLFLFFSFTIYFQLSRWGPRSKTFGVVASGVTLVGPLGYFIRTTPTVSDVTSQQDWSLLQCDCSTLLFIGFKTSFTYYTQHFFLLRPKYIYIHLYNIFIYDKDIP